MKHKINIILVAVIAVFGFALLNSTIGAQNLWPSRLTANTLDVQGANQTQPQWKLSDKLEEAKTLLRNSLPLNFLEGPKKDSKGKIVKDKKGKIILELARKEIALAVLDLETGQIFEKRYWLDEKDIEEANTIRRTYLENTENLPKFMPENIDENFSVTVNWWNNFNSDLSIAKSGSGGNYIIVANKCLIDNDSLAYAEDRTGGKYSDIVYAPYSSSIHITDFIVTGQNFLNKNVAQAFKELEESGIQSKAFPGKLVTDTVSQAFVKNIFMNEQTDPREMFTSDDGGRRLTERVLVRLGMNKEKTFRYTVSKTGASGLGQIMPGTYASIVKGYPNAHLLKDIDIGRVDIVNAIKASTLVFDDHFSSVVNMANKSSKTRALFAQKTQSEIEEIRAAIYNGGPGKYKPLTGTISLAVNETVGFVKKFKMIRDLKLFDLSVGTNANQTQPSTN